MGNRCENIFCIYYKNNDCMLESISLDILGICTEGILINIDENVLEQKRKKQLENLRRSQEN